MERSQAEDIDALFRAILALQDGTECRDFFEDLCTIQELHDMVQRLRVARMLMDGVNYKEISRETGMSTATICRVNRSLEYGRGGYRTVLNRIEEQKGNENGRTAAEK